MRRLKQSEINAVDPLIKSLHPDYVMANLVDLVNAIGVHKFLHGAGHNKDRETLVSVLFAYAIRKWSRREWFIQQIDDPPDFYVVSPTDRSVKERPVDRYGVEIIEINTDDPKEAITTVENVKLKDYAVTPRPALLMFLNTTNAIAVGRALSVWAVRERERFNNFTELYCLHLISFSSQTLWSWQLLNVFRPWSVQCVFTEEFNKGVVYPHALIEKLGVGVEPDTTQLQAKIG